MRISLQTFVVAALLSCAAGPGVLRAQEPARARPVVPVDIEVVVSRYQGDRLISRAPYSLAVNANSGREAQLNMGTEVPVPTTVVTPAGDAQQPAQLIPRSFTYRPIGISISCTAAQIDDGRYEVQIQVEDSSVHASGSGGQDPPIVTDMVVFRNFRSRNTLLLSDGQSRQYALATERVSGEVVRVAVTLRVVK